MSDAPARATPGPPNPSTKLAPCASRLYDLADRLAQEGEAEMAAQVRKVARDLDAAGPDAARAPGPQQGAQ